jgi:ABC-2 type transport system permease protein
VIRTLSKTTWIELKLLLREPLTVVFTFAVPLAVLFVLSSVFGGEAPDPRYYRGLAPMQFYVPAYIALITASMGLVGLPVHLASYRERGVLRRFAASSIPVWNVFGAHMLLTLLVGVVASLLMDGCAVAAYHVSGPVSLAGVAVAVLLSALAFAAIGIFLGIALPSPRAAQSAGILVWFVMMLVSGTGPPSEMLSGPLRAVGEALPLEHAVILIQDPWLGLSWDVPDTLVVLGFMTVPAVLTRPFLHVI